MAGLRVLIADGDPGIRRLVRTNLEARGYETCMAMDRGEAEKIFQKNMPDLVILDTLLPSSGGLNLLRSLRSRSDVPVIMLNTRGNEALKIKYLNEGADDYLSRPFNIEELLARVKALFRRAAVARSMPARPTFACDDLKIRFLERRVTVAEKEIKLTPTEYNLLQELALNADRVLTHSMLLKKIWGPQYQKEREYLRVFVGRLRKKLQPVPGGPDYIITVPWVGYKLRGSLARGPADIQAPSRVLNS